MSSLDFSVHEESTDSAAGLLFHYRNWRRSNPSAEFASFVGLHSNIEEKTLIELASTDLIHLLNAGYDQRAENYIKLSERFSTNTEHMLDLIDAEICTRSDRGESVSPESLVKRFPKLADQIRRMLDVHNIDLEASSFVGGASRVGAKTVGNYRLDVRLDGSGDPSFEIWQASNIETGQQFTVLIWDLTPTMPLASFLKTLEKRKTVRHACLAKLHDFAIHESEPEQTRRAFAAFEFVSGKTLFDLLDSHWIEEAPESKTIQWIRKIQSAHSFLAKELQCLEISPADILIDTNENPILIEFRKLSPWSARADGDLDPAYEQKALRSFGLLIFAICLQETDFEELETQLIAGIEPIKIMDVDPKISAGLNAIYLSCVHPKAKHRYKSLDQLGDDLRRLEAGKSVKATRIQRRWF